MWNRDPKVVLEAFRNSENIHCLAIHFPRPESKIDMAPLVCGLLEMARDRDDLYSLEITWIFEILPEVITDAVNDFLARSSSIANLYLPANVLLGKQLVALKSGLFANETLERVTISNRLHYWSETRLNSKDDTTHLCVQVIADLIHEHKTVKHLSMDQWAKPKDALVLGEGIARSKRLKSLELGYSFRNLATVRALFPCIEKNMSINFLKIRFLAGCLTDLGFYEPVLQMFKRNLAITHLDISDDLYQYAKTALREGNSTLCRISGTGGALNGPSTLHFENDVDHMVAQNKRAVSATSKAAFCYLLCANRLGVLPGEINEMIWRIVFFSATATRFVPQNKRASERQKGHSRGLKSAKS